MSLQNIQLKQIQFIILETNNLLDLLHQTEQFRDVALGPTERANYELQIENYKSLISKYKLELEELENEAEIRGKIPSASKTKFKSYRINLDDSLSTNELDREFAEETKDLLDLMDYVIAKEDISGISTFSPPIFITIQDGDFEPIKTLFQCNYGIVDENTVISFNNVYELNRKKLALNFAVIVTNTYIAPNARSLANQYQIRLLTYEDLLNSIFKVNHYLKNKVQDYEDNNKLFSTYVEVKYLRKGKGKFKDNRATVDEFLVAESVDGDSFEAKGELKAYVDNWLLSEGNSQICLLGEYGTGKTSFATHYFYNQAVSYLNSPRKSRIPLLITLDRYHKSADIVQMITDFLVNECGIRRNFDTFLKLATRGKLLIILDGFDEMAKQVDVNIRRYNFKEITRLLVGDNKIILSGRPNYFLNQSEIVEIFNQETTTNDPYKIALIKSTLKNKTQQYEILSMTLFDRWQIEEFLKNQSEYLKSKGINDWRELQKTIYETYNLQELSRTPVLLEIIIKTISEIRGKVTHINAAKLYEIYTDFWLDREYDEKGAIRWLVTRKEKELFVLELAWTMLLTDNLSPEIHFSDLSERIRRYFSLEKASEIEYFSSDIRFCSYLTHSEVNGNYKFIHKSFMEYFSARYIYKSLFDEKNILAIQTDKPVNNEVFFFLCQMIGSNEINLLRQISREEKDGLNKNFIFDMTVKVLLQSIDICQRRGAIEDNEKWTDILLQYSEEFNYDDGYFWGLINKGKIQIQLGLPMEAEKCFVTALEISLKAENRYNECHSLIQLGTINLYLSEYNQALENFNRALVISYEINNKVSIGQTLANLAKVYESRFEHLKALDYYGQALIIFEEFDDKTNIGQTLSSVGTIYRNLNELDRALEFEHRALAIFRELGDKRGEYLVLTQIGDSHRLISQYEDADRIYKTALEIAQEIGDRQGQSNILLSIGQTYFEIDNFAEGESYHQKSLKISEDLDDRYSVGTILRSLGAVYQEMERFDEAILVYEKSISLLEKVGDMRAVGISQYHLANIYLLQKRFSESSILYERSLEIFGSIGDLRQIGNVIYLKGNTSQKMGNFEEAETNYLKALEINKQIADLKGIQITLESLGDLANERQNFKEAESFYTTSLENASKISDFRSKSKLLLKLARLFRRTENREISIEYYVKYFETTEKLKQTIPKQVEIEYHQLKNEQLNPFVVFMPTYGEDFLGRRKELIKLYEYIQRQHNVILIGERRMGKTSILWQLIQKLEDPMIPVLIDLESFPSQAESLLNGIIRQIINNLLKRNLLDVKRWENYSLTYSYDFTEVIKSILEEAKEKVEMIKIILILDEAEKLYESGTLVSNAIRAALQYNQNLVVVMAGTSQLLNMPSEGYYSPLTNIFTTVILKPFSKEETEHLITRLSHKIGITYKPGALEFIYKLSGGVPFYTQIIGIQISESANKNSLTKIDVADIENILPNILKSFSMDLDYNLNQLNEEERKVLATIANGKPLDTFDPKTINNLELKQLISKNNNNYQFISGLFERWFNQQATTK